MDGVADIRRKNSLQPESAIVPKEIQRPPSEKSNLHQPSGEEHPKAAQDVAELKDYV